MSLQLLYIEDEPANHRLMQEFAAREKYQLRSAFDGSTGLQMAHEQPPDIIVTDINLPDIGGDEICQQLKASPETSAIPIIALTGHSNMHGDRERLLGLGFDEYIPKPFNRTILKMTIERLIKPR